jgi:hypothetical protein
MSHTKLDDEQGPADARAADGRIPGPVPPRWTADEIAEAKRRAADGVWYSSDQTREYLKLVEEEVARTGHCDEARARELLRQINPAR